MTLEQVYAETNQRPLQMLAEGLLEYEQGFAMWRFLHVQLVERIIGPGTGGTGGTLGSKYLQKTDLAAVLPEAVGSAKQVLQGLKSEASLGTGSPLKFRGCPQ